MKQLKAQIQAFTKVVVSIVKLLKSVGDLVNIFLWFPSAIYILQGPNLQDVFFQLFNENNHYKSTAFILKTIVFFQKNIS